MKDKSNNKRLKLFDIAKDGKGISKNEALKQGGFKRFFISYKDNFNKILYVNIFMILGNFPLVFLIATLSGLTKLESTVPLYDVFQNFSHFFAGNMTPDKMSLFALQGLHTENLVPSVMTYVFYGISALSLFTFGCVNVGTAYILRNIAKGDPVFTWTDFWYAVKRNYKQALPFGIVDLAINGILIFNIYTMMIGAGSFFANTMFWANIVLFILYFFMRYYIYVQMVTFKLKIFKIIKNSLIFALIGIKRNIVALFGIVLAVLLEVSLFFGFGGILIPFAVAAPLAILFSTLAYMKVYAAYFKIKEIMIDPYTDNSTDNDEEPLMRDDVTERQRLEEIKAKNGIV